MAIAVGILDKIILMIFFCGIEALKRAFFDN
jgi:hypothetical protein